MCAAKPLLPHTPSWRGAQLKHRDNFLYLYLYNSSCFNAKEKKFINSEPNPMRGKMVHNNLFKKVVAELL
jgi:hypothetical protein